MNIKVNMNPLESVSTLPYLGRTISFNNSDWATLYQNIRNTKRRWGMMSGVLVKAGATVRARPIFYKAVVQAVLIYGSESWVII